MLGLATTIGVSWTLALVRLRSTKPVVIALQADGHGRTLAATRAAYVGRLAVQVNAANTFSDISPEQMAPFDRVCPAWIRAELAPWLADPQSVSHSRAMLATGWPMLATYTTFEQQPSVGYWWNKARDGVVVRAAPAAPDFLDLLSPRERVLATRILPLGLAVDTGVYAGAWWVLIFGPGAIRRWIRRRGKRCEACGYSREGLDASATCPECGAGRG